MPPLRTDLFSYELPRQLIAQKPAEQRDRSRLLVVDRATRTITHRIFADLPQFLRSGDMLFRNVAAVLPARLYGRRFTGGLVECLLLRPESSHGKEVWRCLLHSGARMKEGETISDPGKDEFSGELLTKNADGTALVRFVVRSGEPLTELAKKCGEMPLPPYIERRRNEADRDLDRDRYQTIYAEQGRPVAVAAPTAGLHFTPELLARLSGQGVRTFDLTLHIGLGTFRPIVSEIVEKHLIHREAYELPPATQNALFPPLGGRRIAVGTTSVRAIEDFLENHSAPLKRAHVTEAATFIFPPRLFRGVDALITNFHQPRSTLLCLVAAFLTPGSTDGIAWLQEIYREAIFHQYRFFSYGDAMLIL